MRTNLPTNKNRTGEETADPTKNRHILKRYILFLFFGEAREFQLIRKRKNLCFSCSRATKI